jgi:hypothetical protein
MERPLSPSQFDSASVLSVLRNLKIDCSSNTQVIIRSGTSVGSDDGKKVMTLTGDKTLDITTSGVNGLDTGSEAGNTWYYVYLIWNPTTALVNGLLSASYTSPTLPSGYTQKRLIGAVRNDGSSNFKQFKQVNNDVYFDGGRAYLINGGNTGGTTFVGLDTTSYVPTAVAGVIHLVVQQVTVGTYVAIGWDGITMMAACLGTSEVQFNIPHNAGNIYYYNAAGLSYIGLSGFILNL